MPINNPAFWLFANGFLTGLNIICVLVLVLHLFVRRKNFSWGEHAMSVGIAVYLIGEAIFHSLYLHLWASVLKTGDPMQIAPALLHLFGLSVTKILSVFNIVGMTIIIWVLTVRLRWFWLWSLIVSSVAAAILTFWLYR